MMPYLDNVVIATASAAEDLVHCLRELFSYMSAKS